MLLRLARNLRRETEALGVTSHQATLLALVQARPGLSLRELASEEGISAPSLSGHVDRLEAAGLLRRVRSSDDRRRVGLELTAEGTSAAEAHPGASHDVARRRVSATSPTTSASGSSERSPRSSRSWSRVRERPRARARAPDVPLPPPSPELPPLLRGPGRLARRHLDAEHRARVARDRALRLARSPSARSPSAASRRSSSSASSPAC